MSAIKEMTDDDVQSAVDRRSEIKLEKEERRLLGERRVDIVDHPLNIEYYDISKSLAVEFGRRRGWSQARKSFKIEALIRRIPSYNERYATEFGEYHDLFDHCYFYRERKPPYRAAAVAAHLYMPTFDIDGCHEVAKSLQAKRKKASDLGLSLELITDFPSWWYPGQTNLVLYKPVG